MSEQSVIYKTADEIVTITLNRPKVLNALNLSVLRELLGAVERAREENAAAVVITGNERAFAAGADIDEMRQLGTQGALAFGDLGHRTMSAIESLDVPVIAMVHGYALGGGLELALACDLIYSATDAKFGQPEVGLGIIPGFGGTQRLARLVGRSAAKEMIFTGGIIDAQKAKEIGLAREVFEPDELEAEVMKKANLIRSKGRLAVAAAKRVMNKAVDLALDPALELEKQAFSALFGTDDQVEGMTAFLEKRPPAFENR